MLAMGSQWLTITLCTPHTTRARRASWPRLCPLCDQCLNLSDLRHIGLSEVFVGVCGFCQRLCHSVTFCPIWSNNAHSSDCFLCGRYYPNGMVCPLCT